MEKYQELDIGGMERREWHLWVLTLIIVLVLTTITVGTYYFILGDVYKGSSDSEATAFRALGGLFILIILFCAYILHTRFNFGKLKMLLVELSSMVSSTTELEVLLSAFASRIARASSVAVCQIALLTPAQNALKIRAAYAVGSVTWNPQIGKTYLLSRSLLCRQVIKDREQVILSQKNIANMGTRDDTGEIVSGGLENLHSVFIIPMVTNDRVIGIAILGERRGSFRNRFSHSKIIMVQSLLKQAASAIDHARLINEVIERNKAIKQANFDSIKALSEALETKDVYTRGHSDRTVANAARLAKKLELSQEEQEWVKYAAILHDIGKIGIPESILNKPGPLTDEEYNVMKKHPMMGAEIVRNIKFLDPVVPMILHDHEQYDGGGYPMGLAREAIPLGSRIIAIVDAYDAMTTDRVYQKAMSKEKAIERLRECAGNKFDPWITGVFIDILSPSD